jgi:hypothetical protein
MTSSEVFGWKVQLFLVDGIPRGFAKRYPFSSPSAQAPSSSPEQQRSKRVESEGIKTELSRLAAGPCGKGGRWA